MQTLSEAADLIRAGKVSPVDLTRDCLSRIEQLDPALNSFITVAADLAMQQAREAEAAIQRGGYRGPLHGIPVALKDLYETAGVRTTAASGWLVENVPDQDSPVAQKLNEAGAILLGKLNMQEWALGVTNLTSHFGPVHNPWNTDYITGGSSGGSGAAVAAGLCYGAFGSDTGGSIRIPAWLCGIVGLKPTFGRISARGVIPLSWSLDHAGPMTRTVRDAALLLQATAGYDPLDPVSVNAPVDDYLATLSLGVEGWRIAVAHDPNFSDIDPEIAAAIKAAVKVFESLGAHIEEVALPMSEARGDSWTILHADAAAYHQERLKLNPALFGPELLPRLQQGLSVFATEYAEARYHQRVWRRQFEHTMSDYDVVILPTTPIPAVPMDDEAAVQNARDRLSRFTAAFNLVGLPALSVPCGFTAQHLPIGLQIVGSHWAEAKVLRAGYAYEQATSWHNAVIPTA